MRTLSELAGVDPAEQERRRRELENELEVIRTNPAGLGEYLARREAAAATLGKGQRELNAALLREALGPFAEFFEVGPAGELRPRNVVKRGPR